jgi:hypothetical protein
MPAIEPPTPGPATSSHPEPGLHALLLLEVDDVERALADVKAEFPSVTVARVKAGSAAPSIDAADWAARASEDRSVFDAAIDRAAEGDGALGLVGRGAPGVARVAWEILTAYQRLVGRRNRWSRTDAFDAVLRAHARLHASDKPLVVADRRHALDTWQWLLRVEPGATFAAQVAALFHDVERLESEADRRVEHLADDYDAFKDAHARRGAVITMGVLEALGAPCAERERVADLLQRHERGGSADPELRALVDADALSFFSLNSPGYVDYFGPEQARKKVGWTLARLSPARRALVSRLRLRADVRALVDAVHPPAEAHVAAEDASALRGETGE